ncbi:MAG: hypothetical protein ABL925_09940 [Methylococcales bacterium]
MNSQSEKLPPVLVLGIDTPIGLTLIRELGERNVQVYGIAHSADSIGLASRYLTQGFVHVGNEDDLIKLINDIAQAHDVKFLMTVSEQRIVFLQNQLARLQMLPLVPDAAAMQTVLNKDKVYQLAKTVGIDTPIDYLVTEKSIPEEMCFPVILKWANPNTVIPLLNKQQLPFHKCEYCYTKQDLLAALQRYEPIQQYPLVQSYCPGYGLGQMIYMHQGRPVLCFQHRRIHEWPPEGGFSTLCESVALSEHQDLLQKSVKLLQAINWEGPAMVEYRFNPNTGQAVLMEINGRFWGSLPLAYHAQAHFAWTHYAVQVLGEIPSQAKLLAGVRCMFFIPELKRLLVVLFRPSSIQDKTMIHNAISELATFCNHYLTRQAFYVFNWRDPKPFLTDLYNLSIGRVLKFKS